MIGGVVAVAPSGDGPVRAVFSQAPQSSSASATAAEPAAASAVKAPESSGKGGSSTGTSEQGGDAGSRTATGSYLASLLAAQITGRSPVESRPVKITPERLSSLISYLEASVASTSPSELEEHAVDVKS